MDAKTRSKASFDRQAGTYDESDYSRYPRECYPHVLNAIGSVPFGRVLDLGCGTGAILEQIGKRSGAAELFGLDLSEKMIAQAARRLGERASLSVGDAEALPYEDERFDLVCCVESFHHYPDCAKALSEVRRVLKPGGVFLLCDTWARTPARQIMNFFIRFSDDGDVRIYSRREIGELLTGAGLRQQSWDLITPHAYLSMSQK